MVLQSKHYGTRKSVFTYNLELSNFLSNEFKIHIFLSEEEQSIRDWEEKLFDLRSKVGNKFFC